MTRHSLHRLAGVLAIVTLLLAACDSGDETADPPTSSSAVTSSTSAGTSTSTTVPCEPGGRTIVREGVEVREFCGPARAEVTLGEETFEFMPGECSRHEDWLSANLGVEVIEPDAGDEIDRPRFRSFSLLMGRHPGAADDAPPVDRDGAFQVGSLSFAVPGTSWFVTDKTITLAGTRTVGTIVGSAVASDARDGAERSGQVGEETTEITGVFTCDANAVPLDQVADLIETETDDNS